jgi:hypothetical protein
MLEALLAEYPEDNSLLTLQKRLDAEYLRQNPPPEGASLAEEAAPTESVSPAEGETAELGETDESLDAAASEDAENEGGSVEDTTVTET